MKTVPLKTKVHHYWYILLVPVLGIIFFVIAVKAVNFVDYPNSDFFTFWFSGRLASLGQNPYNSQIWIAGHHQFDASWISDTAFIYPLPLSLLFLPLGLLPLYQAFIVWVVLLQFMIISSIALLLVMNSNFSSKHLILPLLMGVMLFRPTIITLLNGQLSGMLLFLLTCIAYLWEKEKWSHGAVLLAVLALKPSLGIPIIVLLSIYLLQQKQIRALTVAAISGMVLLFAGLIQNPAWVIEYWNVGNTKLSQTFGFSPTIWGISALTCKYDLNCVISYGAFVSLFFLIGYLYLLIKKQKAISPAWAVSLAVVITLLLTPYIWPYDQLLLVIPITMLTIGLARNGYRYIPVSLIFMAIDIFALVLLGVSAKIQLEIWNVLIPLLIFGLSFWYLSKDKSASMVGVD